MQEERDVRASTALYTAMSLSTCRNRLNTHKHTLHTRAGELQHEHDVINTQHQPRDLLLLLKYRRGHLSRDIISPNHKRMNMYEPKCCFDCDSVTPLQHGNAACLKRLMKLVHVSAAD